MKKRNVIILATIATVFLLQLLISNYGPQKIINVHESIESKENVIQLQDAMKKTGISKIVLSGIPEDILYFDGTVQSLADSKNNNAIIEQVIKEYPNQFDYICTIDPNDVNRLELLETCIQNGAVGVKLYNGYSYSHTAPIDDSVLNDFYAKIAEENKILLLPVNTSEYTNELTNILILNPTLKVICPHYCLSSKNLPRLTELMDAHKNLYVDTSFGSLDLAIEGFDTITKNPEEFTAFFDQFADRILFGTDNVITTYENKDSEFITSLYQTYLDVYKGLALPNSITKKVFWQNWQDLVK
ncbi:MAG: amidohydrolase family protein [Candidatus Gracilibacteria bacterium]